MDSTSNCKKQKEIKGMADIKTEDEETTITKKPLFSFQMMIKQTK